MVSKLKIAAVESMSALMSAFPVVGMLNMENLPARQLQVMKAMLREKGVTIIMARKRLIRRAIEAVDKENIQQLPDNMVGMPALLVTKDNPFTLYAILEKNKSPAPAKAGQTAPKDVLVKAGPTTFAPGPIISELGAVGIKTKVEGGKLAIISDTVLVKEGDEISQPVADMLKRLDIQPMEIGLDLRAVWEKGTIFDGKQLRIDEEEYFNNFTTAASWAFNLAVEMAYPTEGTIGVLLSKASSESRAVALEGGVLTDETVGELIGKVEREALSLQKEANVPVEAKSVEEPAEEPEAPTEETPAEESEAPAEETPAEEPEEPAEETPAEEPEAPAEETPAEEPEEPEAPAEETPAEEPEAEDEPTPDPDPTPEPVPQPDPTPEPLSEPQPEPVPSAHDLMKQKEEQPEITIEEPVERSSPRTAFIKEEKPMSADDLLADLEDEDDEDEILEIKDNQDEETKKAEELFEKLKKQGTLREDN